MYYNPIPKLTQAGTQRHHLEMLIGQMDLSINSTKLAGRLGPVFEQLGTDHTRPMGLTGHIRVPNRAKPDPMASKAHARDKMLPGGARENLTGGSRTGAIVETTLSKNSFMSQIFLVEKKEGGQRPVINLKSLNTFVRTEHFKMEGLHILPDLIQAQDWMIKMDLKDAYLQVPIHKEHQHLLQFQWNGKIFQFHCLPFGLTSALQVFSKVMKPVVGTLRHMGIRLIIYLNNILILHQVKEELIQITTLICQMLWVW